MKFDVKVVKNCLLEEGEVYTVRGYRSHDRYAAVEVDNVDYIRERLHQVNTKQDIEGFLGLSGFDDLKEWWNKIEGFGAAGGYLYHVKLL